MELAGNEGWRLVPPLEILAELVDQLDDPERDVLSRLYWGQESLGSIARSYGTDKSVIVRVRNRGLKALRRVLDGAAL